LRSLTFHLYKKKIYLELFIYLLFFFLKDELLGIVSTNIRIPFDANEVITRIVDGSRFMAFKPLYGPNIITGWAYIHGEFL
jgi:acetyl-CoA carboxylase carboxyltransferase component